MKEDLTLKEVQEAKMALESKMNTLLCSFSYEYGVKCDVSFESHTLCDSYTGDASYAYSTNIEIKL